MVPFAGLLAALQEIPDPRRRQGRRYPMAHLLLFSILAVLVGATSYRRIRLFIGVHRERLNATFGARFRRAPAVRASPEHAGRYLASFAWRHDRRFQLESLIPRRVHSAVRTAPLPYAKLVAS